MVMQRSVEPPNAGSNPVSHPIIVLYNIPWHRFLWNRFLLFLTFFYPVGLAAPPRRSSAQPQLIFTAPQPNRNSFIIFSSLSSRFYDHQSSKHLYFHTRSTPHPPDQWTPAHPRTQTQGSRHLRSPCSDQRQGLCP